MQLILVLCIYCGFESPAQQIPNFLKWKIVLIRIGTTLFLKDLK